MKKRYVRIGEWPFDAVGVDCRVCLHEPCKCPLVYIPFFHPDDIEIENPECFSSER